jgi:hypothetical protein
MAKKNPGHEPSHSIVSSVFEDFLATLSGRGVVEDKVIKRLHSALLDKRDLSAEAIRRALFSEEPSQ